MKLKLKHINMTLDLFGYAFHRIIDAHKNVMFTELAGS